VFPRSFIALLFCAFGLWLASFQCHNGLVGCIFMPLDKIFIGSFFLILFAYFFFGGRMKIHFVLLRPLAAAAN